MKVVTANLLSSGEVVYLGESDVWVFGLNAAAQFDDAAAQDALEIAQTRVLEITGAYLIALDVDADERKPAGRDRLRESIRNAGPTVRVDLGKQACAQ